MGKDTRRVARRGLRSQCRLRVRLRRCPGKLAYAHIRIFPPDKVNENYLEKQYTSNEEMIHAGHFSHSGRFARIYCWRA